MSENVQNPALPLTETRGFWQTELHDQLSVPIKWDSTCLSTQLHFLRDYDYCLRMSKLTVENKIIHVGRQGILFLQQE